MSVIDLDNPDTTSPRGPRLADVAERVLAGEEVLLVKAGRPAIRLITVAADAASGEAPGVGTDGGPAATPGFKRWWLGGPKLPDDFELPGRDGGHRPDPFA